MRIERTFDRDFITHCITEPSVWRVLADDNSGNPDLYFHQMRDEDYWIRVEDYGVFCLEYRSSIMYEGHALLLPVARGKGVEIMAAVIGWVFLNTPCLRLIASVPVFNLLSLSVVGKVGFQKIGVNGKSFLRDGKLHDQIMFGLNKEDWHE